MGNEEKTSAIRTLRREEKKGKSWGEKGKRSGTGAIKSTETVSKKRKSHCVLVSLTKGRGGGRGGGGGEGKG